jgi:hypothetical protein
LAIDLVKYPLGSAEFMGECARIGALTNAAEPKPATLGLLIQRYRGHAAFLDLAPRTRADYQSAFDYLKPIVDTPLVKFDRPLVVRIRDKAASTKGRRQGNYVKSVLSLLFAWGCERGFLATNPAAGIKGIRRKRGLPDANPPWSDEARHIVFERLPDHMRAPIGIMMFTGLGPKDTLTLPKSFYKDGEIATRRSKTGEPVFWQCPTDLSAILAAAPTHNAITLCANSRGRPWTESGFNSSWQKFRRQAAPFGLIPVMPNLGTGTEDRAALIKEIRTATAGLQVPLRAIAFDTLRRAIPGKAENKQEDMSVFVNNCGEIAASFGAHVHTIHHTPRADDSHGSGSNALDAASDVILRVRRVGDTTRSTATVDRLKDGPDKSNGAGFGFELVQLQVGADRNGDPVMSCSVDVTEDKEAPKVARSMTKKVGGRPPRNNAVFVNAFIEALGDFGEMIWVRGDGPQVRAVDVQRVRDEFKRRYATGEGDTKKQTDSANKAFARALNQLPSQFATETQDGRELIWRIDQ